MLWSKMLLLIFAELSNRFVRYPRHYNKARKYVDIYHPHLGKSNANNAHQPRTP